MKIRLPRQEFLDALLAVAAVVSGRTTKPILSCVKIATDAEAVELSATDGEAALCMTVSSFAVEQAGQTVVSAERLLSIIREMPDAEIALEADDRHCTVSGAGSEFKIFVHPVDDFPAMPSFDDEPDLIIDGLELWRMIDLTIYAAARETSRYAINGVLWEKKNNKLLLVATDGRRLARAAGPLVESNSADFNAIVPSKALAIFDRIFNPNKEHEGWTIDIKILPNQILLRGSGRLLSTVLVEGNFPNYEDVIPQGNDKVAKIKRLELSGAIKRAALLTTDEARAVKLAFTPNQLVITGHSPEQGEARVELPVEYDGPPVEIGFNPLFVNDALKALTTDDILMELQESARPGIIRGGDHGDFLYVVMPVSL